MRPRRTPSRASGSSWRRCWRRGSSTAGWRRMRAANRPSSPPRIAPTRQRAGGEPDLAVGHRARRPLARGADRSLRDHRRRAARAAQRGRDRPRAQQHPHLRHRRGAGRGDGAVAAPCRAAGLARSTAARWSPTAQTTLDNFERNAPEMTPGADRGRDAAACSPAPGRACW